MAVSSFLKKNPLFRLALPLVAGIIAGWYCGVDMLHIYLSALLSALAICFGMFRFSPKWLFGLGVSLLMFSAGLFVEENEEERKSLQWSSEKLEYRAQLLEEPVVKGSAVKALSSVVLCDTSALHDVRKQGVAYLYFPRSVEAEELEIGSVVSFKGVVSAYMNAGNPAEFDSERFYYIKGIAGYSYVPQGGWTHVGSGDFTLQMRALQLRGNIVGMYRDLSFEEEELALLSALTVGEKSDFPKDLKESYSVAGASHILALSGMHLGVFYMLLVALLPLWSRKRLFLIFREAFIVLFVWAFSFVAGLTPSVVRAAVLFTLISVGRCLRQDASGISSLSFAAIVMLVVSPHLLFDISFQLSFAAVLSILLLVPPLQRFFKIQERGIVLRYVINLFILSFVAQLGTLPFVWYYFGVFPLYFMLTNLVVVPLAFVLMSVAVCVWVLSFVPFMQEYAAMLLQFIVGAMNGCVGVIAGLPGASLSLPPIGVAGACAVSLMLCMLSFAIVNCRKWLLLFSVCAMLCFAIVLILLPDEKINGDYMIIYNNRKNPLLHAVSRGGDNYLVSTVPQLDAEYEYVSTPFIKREKLPAPQWANWRYADSSLTVDEGLVEFAGLKVRLVDNEQWRDNIYVQPADVVVLCRGFLGKIEELVEAYPAGCLVLDASLYKRSRERIMRECAVLGIEFVDISSQGAMMLLPSGENFRLVPMSGK